MTFEKLVQGVLELCPSAAFERDNEGQIVVDTGYWDAPSSGDELRDHPPITDAEALQTIRDILKLDDPGYEWDSGTIEEVAQVIQQLDGGS